MKLTTFSDPILLIEQHRYESRKILKESCEGLTKEQRLVVENIYKHFTPLIEATLTAQQIGQLFGEVEKTAAASSDNKTALGKAAGAVGTAAKGGAEAVKKANEILNKAGTWLKNTTPVQNFDQKFNDLKQQVTDKLGGEDSKIVQQVQKLGELAKNNPGKTAAVIGVLTVLAGLAAGPVGGMVAGQVLRGASELIQGKDLSTALGKGAKSAAIGALAGGVGDAVAGDEVGSVGSDAGGDLTIDPSAQAATDKLLGKYPPDEYTYTAGRGGNITIADSDGNVVAKQDISRTGLNGQQFVDYAQNNSGATADAANAGSTQYSRNSQPVSKDEYDQKSFFRGSDEQGQLQGVTADQIRNHPAYQAEIERSGDNVEGRRAASLKARAAIMKGESIYRQTRPLSEGQIYFLFNRVEQLNEGPLLDKLKAAVVKLLGQLKIKQAK
jgi:hypothetical protein